MSEIEFTGERVIPGLVDADLFNEHVARYRFAAWFLAQHRGPVRVLDAACGSGYGAREFSSSSVRVVSVDIAGEATALAHKNSDAVVQASCEALPFADQSFDLIAAFEMIEHLQDASAFLAGARRVLRADGVLLVSTPNRAYYAEARGTAGSNPFHTHEYDYEEFRAVLQTVFPHIRLWTQNHAPGIVFAPTAGSGSARALQAADNGGIHHAHFFLAACSAAPITERGLFAWIPGSGNILRERERHIARLAGELIAKDQWLADLHKEHAALQTAHAATEAELRQRNRWAESLNRELADAAQTLATLEREAEERLAWVQRVEAQLTEARDHIENLDQTIVERTDWARSLEYEKNQAIAAYREMEAAAEAQLREAATQRAQAGERHAQHLRLIAASHWVRLGRKLKVGPEIADR